MTVGVHMIRHQRVARRSFGPFQPEEGRAAGGSYKARRLRSRWSVISAYVGRRDTDVRTSTIFQNKPNKVLRDYDFIQSRDMRMNKLSVMMDFSGEVRIILLGGLENDLIVAQFTWLEDIYISKRWEADNRIPWSHW